MINFQNIFIANRLGLNVVLAAAAAMFVCASASSGSDDTNRILDLLSERSATSYLQQGDNQLMLLDTERTIADNAIVFEKMHGGHPILGANVTVILSNDGAIESIADDASTAELKFGPDLAVVDSETAINIVHDNHMGSLESLGSNSELVWFRMGRNATLAWQIETRVADTGQPVSPTKLRSTVDAATGKLLSQSQLDTNKYNVAPGETGVLPRIVINDTIGAAGSQAYAAQADFDSVISLAFGGSSYCTGTLIAPNTVLSARHCDVFVGDFVQFGNNSAAPTFTAVVQSVSLPAGAGSLLDGGDVAILTLTSNVPGSVASPMRLIDQTTELVGQTCSLVGFGQNGLGSVGHGGTSDGLKWGGENVIDVYGTPATSSGSNIISTDFDNGTGGANTIGGSSASPLTLEATTAPGDSGGPVMVNVAGEWVIAGALSGGTLSTSAYGDISWWTGTAIYRSQIEAAGGQYIDGVTPPANDNWNGTFFAGALPFNVNGTNVGATTETGEQELDITDATVWWFFTAPADGMVTVDTFGSDFDTVLHIYDGFNDGASDVSELNPIANNDQSGGTNQSQVVFPVTAGTCYEIRVGGFFGDTGNIVLNAMMGAPPMPPANDDWDNTISAGPVRFTVMGTNVDATTEPGEQELDFTDATVWWFFNATETGMVTIDTFGSDFDTVLHIYDGFNEGASNVSELNPIANNDQAGGTNQSQVTFMATAGTCYEIRVGGFMGDTGNIVLNGMMTPAKPPANDDFANTIFLGTLPFNTTGTNENATEEPGELNLDFTGATVWWFFNAPGDGTVTIDTFGSDFDTVLHIYDGFFPGASPGDLNFLAENDQAGGTNQSQVTFPVTAGSCYEVRVGGYFSDMGNIDLNGIFTPKGILIGDVNCDGVVDLLDVAPFVDALTSGLFDPKADINQYGMVDLLDVGPFVELLSS